ncbi:hypothetical protein ALC62_15193 [Cyphomyrmex costatus]|uniref:Uncharacterized protein n=1 Tax=Cyphomyrmex costatus TaxID=456900 RepID=A0A151I7P8_9HYME|nr:hypothetical protein ALC62_15193 [Cyphomyrmex costatus]
MKNAIYASIYHAVPTDQKPQHSLCPEVPKSWCFFQAAKVNNKKPGPHNVNIHTPLNQLCFKKILPLYQRLTEDSLLLRCSRCLTQNVNESLHNVIWSRCSKEVFVGNSRVKIAASLTVCEYNLGTTRTVCDIMKKLGLSAGSEILRLTNEADSRRLARGIEKSTEKFKKTRRIIALASSRRKENYIENEGTMYGAGMF